MNQNAAATILARHADEQRNSIEREYAQAERLRTLAGWQWRFGEASERAASAAERGDADDLTMALLEAIEAAAVIEKIGTIPNFVTNESDRPHTEMQKLVEQWHEDGELKLVTAELFAVALTSPDLVPMKCREILHERVLNYEISALVSEFLLNARAKWPEGAPKRSANYVRDSFLRRKYQEALRIKQGKQGAPTYKAAADAWNAAHPRERITTEATKKVIQRAPKASRGGDSK